MPGQWSTGTWGIVDCCSTDDYMSASFAKILNLDFDTMDVSTTGALCELRVRPGGRREMGWLPHRCQFHRLGRVTVTINLAHVANSPRHMAVCFWVFDDGVLPNGSSLDFVLSWETARRCPTWMSEAARTDDTSQCFATTLIGETVPPRQAPQPDLARLGASTHGSNAAGPFWLDTWSISWKDTFGPLYAASPSWSDLWQNGQGAPTKGFVVHDRLFVTED